MLKQPRRIAMGCTALFFGITWLLLLSNFIYDIRNAYEGSLTYVSPYKYSRWAMAHDRSKTAVLVRDYFFDLNFRLFIIDPYSGEVPDDIKKALWTSRDYEPTTYRNLREDIEWSRDSSVVAVTIEGEYAFAHDFTTGRNLEDPDQIRSLLEERNPPPVTPQD